MSERVIVEISQDERSRNSSYNRQVVSKISGVKTMDDLVSLCAKLLRSTAQANAEIIKNSNWDDEKTNRHINAVANTLKKFTLDELNKRPN